MARNGRFQLLKAGKERLDTFLSVHAIVLDTEANGGAGLLHGVQNLLFLLFGKPCGFGFPRVNVGRWQLAIGHDEPVIFTDLVERHWDREKD
jgi:hypothetical protein